METFAENLKNTMKELLDGVYAAGKAESGGAEPVIKALTVTENGTYAAPDGVDGYSPVTVNVPTSGGKENLLKYVSSSGNLVNLFYLADFGDKDEIKVKIDDPPANTSQMFNRAVGFTKLTIDFPLSKVYNGFRFIYGYSGGDSTIEELVLPDGIKFSNIQDFARHDVNLKTITGEINLSECEINTNCFYGCTALQDISFVQESITMSISFANSPNLSKKSINSIIKALVDSSDLTGQTLTLSRAAVDAAFLYLDQDGIETPGSSSPEWIDTVGNIHFWTITLV